MGRNFDRLTKIRFAELFTELMKVYGAYPDLEKKRIYEHVRDIEAVHFKKMIEQFVDDGKKPRVPDFRSKAKYFRTIQEGAFNAASKNLCPLCHDTGVCEVHDTETDSFFLGACSCEIGSDCYWTLPQFNEELFPTLRQLPLPTGDFKPANDGTKVDAHLSSAVEWYRSKIKHSMDEWKRIIDRERSKIS